MSRLNIILLIFISYGLQLIGQGGVYLREDKSHKIPFQLISNLIVLPVDVNGVTLSFVLDTGASKPILFNISDTDSVGLKNTDPFFIQGLGSKGKIEALRSTGNLFKIGNATLVNRDLFVLYDKSINFTPRLGVVVHGIIGYDVFKDFVVELNYNAKFIRLYKSDRFKRRFSKKWKKESLILNNSKPFLKSRVRITEGEKDVKLLLDTGSSDAIWLFKNDSLDILPPSNMFFEDFLGKGLSGPVYGLRSKVVEFEMNHFNLYDVNVAFPDSSSVDVRKIIEDRNGSIGGEILKRFNFFFDYANTTLYLKKNANFNQSFTYNNSGITLEHNGIMFVREEISLPSINNNQENRSVQVNTIIDYRTTIKPAYEIVEIRASSNAYAAGLRKGDVLLKVNSKYAFEYKLAEINSLFHGKTGKPIKLLIERNGVNMLFKFRLDDAFKKNEPLKD